MGIFLILMPQRFSINEFKCITVAAVPCSRMNKSRFPGKASLLRLGPQIYSRKQLDKTASSILQCTPYIRRKPRTLHIRPRGRDNWKIKFASINNWIAIHVAYLLAFHTVMLVSQYKHIFLCMVNKRYNTMRTKRHVNKPFAMLKSTGLFIFRFCYCL